MGCTAAWNQKAYRGRNDNGNETAATWKANQNTAWTQAVDENFRVRFEIQETAGCAGANKVWRLQYKLNGGSWTDASASSSVVRASASPNLADAANLTDQLTAGTGTFQGSACFDEVDCNAGSNATDVAASGHSECEFCVQVRSADVVNGDTVYLRATDAGTAFAAYDANCSLTVSEADPKNMSPGTGVTTYTGQVPTFSKTENKNVSPGNGAISFTSYAPVIATAPKNILPSFGEFILTGYAATVFASLSIAVSPGTGGITFSGYAPTVETAAPLTGGLYDSEGDVLFGSDGRRLYAKPDGSKNVLPGYGELLFAAYSPTVVASDKKEMLPGLGELLLAGYNPTATASDHKAVTPDYGQIIYSGQAPSVSVSLDKEMFPGTGEALYTGFAPLLSLPRNIGAGLGEVLYSGFVPSVVATANINIQPGTGELALTGYAGTVAVTDNKVVSPGLGEISYNGFVPGVAVSDNKRVYPDTGAVSFEGYAPGVAVTYNLVINCGQDTIKYEGFAPSADAGTGVYMYPALGELAYEGFIPSAGVTFALMIRPEAGVIRYEAFEPEIVAGHLADTILPAVNNVLYTGHVPTVDLPFKVFRWDGTQWIRVRWDTTT